MLLIKGFVRETYSNMLNNQWQTNYKHAKKGENMLKFNNHYSQQRVAFVIYADFEAITKKYKVVDRTITNHTPKPIRLDS